MTRIVATADLHGHLPDIPACDLLLIGGDVCPVWNHDRKFQAEWLRSEFSEWLVETPSDEVVWIGGNHDFVLEDMRRAKIDKLPGFYLNNEAVTACGLKIWGSPLTPTFHNWAFMRDDRGLAETWAAIPRDIDVLMVHGPMYGILDEAGMEWVRGEGFVPSHTGSATLRNRLEYVDFPNLKMFVHGHIHEAYGKDKFKDIPVYNVSHMDGKYEPTNPPVVIDIE